MVWTMADRCLPQNLALIRLMVLEKTRFTDDGRTTDARAMASRAKNFMAL